MLDTAVVKAGAVCSPGQVRYIDVCMNNRLIYWEGMHMRLLQCHIWSVLSALKTSSGNRML